MSELPPIDPRPVSPTWLFVLVACAGLVVAMRATDQVQPPLDENPLLSLEKSAAQTLDAIAERLARADLASCEPSLETPAFSSSLEYALLGDEAGRERIEVTATGRVLLIEGVGSGATRSLVLGRDVTSLLEGELKNGVDDNGNGLVDEPGLCFVLDRNAVLVALTLRWAPRSASRERWVQVTRTRTVQPPRR